MQEITQSFYLVVGASSFLTLTSLVFITGIFWGWWYDQKIIGFKRSLNLIVPFVVLLITINASRIYEASLSTKINPNGYNGLITLVLSSVVYIIGLFIGHMLDTRGRKKAQEIHRHKAVL
jgi:hypothetical protein